MLTQVGSVRGDEYEREEPPDRSDDSGGSGFRIEITSLMHEGYSGEPEAVSDGTC